MVILFPSVGGLRQHVLQLRHRKFIVFPAEMAVDLDGLSVLNHLGNLLAADADDGPVSYTHLDVYKRQDGARRRLLSQHDVDGEVLHGRVQHLLHLPVQPVNLVHEEHVALLEIV